MLDQFSFLNSIRYHPTMTFSTRTAATRSFGVFTNWLLVLTAVLWAECLMGYNCAVITRNADDNVQTSSNTAYDEGSIETTDEPISHELQHMNCYLTSDCYEDCTERIKGQMDIPRDCTPMNGEYGFFGTFNCQCHLGNFHEEDYEGSNELPMFPVRAKSKDSDIPISKRSGSGIGHIPRFLTANKHK